jgi:hypothetical protein
VDFNGRSIGKRAADAAVVVAAIPDSWHKQIDQTEARRVSRRCCPFSFGHSRDDGGQKNTEGPAVDDRHQHVDKHAADKPWGEEGSIPLIANSPPAACFFSRHPK